MKKIAFITMDRTKIEDITAFLSKRPDVFVRLLSISKYEQAAQSAVEYGAELVLIDGSAGIAQEICFELCRQLRQMMGDKVSCVLISDSPEPHQELNNGEMSLFDACIPAADVHDFLVRKYGK